MLSESHRGPAAVLFGSERAGLTNEQLEAAHLLIRIPASAAYPSLNLAMAVQIVAYELFRARGVQIDTAPAAGPLAEPQEMERLYEHLAQVLEEIDFRDRTQGGTPSHGAAAAPVPTRGARSQRSQHPARHSDGGAEPPAAGRRRLRSASERRRSRSISTTPPRRRWIRRWPRRWAAVSPSPTAWAMPHRSRTSSAAARRSASSGRGPRSRR